MPRLVAPARSLPFPRALVLIAVMPFCSPVSTAVVQEASAFSLSPFDGRPFTPIAGGLDFAFDSRPFLGAPR